jgi:hypothetical protein
VPPPLDAGYQALARMRFRLFGRYDACRVPTAAIASPTTPSLDDGLPPAAMFPGVSTAPVRALALALALPAAPTLECGEDATSAWWSRRAHRRP